jgi:biuret amidohydrolase
VIESLCIAGRSAGLVIIAVTHARRHVDDGPAGRPPGRQLLPPRRGGAELLLDRLECLAPFLVASSGIDGFTGSSLEQELVAHRISHLLLCGFASELTVDSTLRSANDRGFECLVLTDALATIDHDVAARLLHSVTMSGGIFGALGTTTDVLSVLTPPR